MQFSLEWESSHLHFASPFAKVALGPEIKQSAEKTIGKIQGIICVLSLQNREGGEIQELSKKGISIIQVKF